MRLCYNCGYDNTYVYKNGRSQWHKRNNKLYCHRCYNRIFINPINNPKNHIINSPKRIGYKGKQVYIEFNPRIGVCNLCRAVAGVDCKTTHMHHIEYNDDDPLKDTIELCASCHRKQR